MLILLATDGSAPALDAAQHAVALLENGLRATFLLVNVQEPTHLYEVVLAPSTEAIRVASEQAGAHALRPAEALMQSAGAPFESVVVHGEPAQTLLEIAQRRRVDAIILGTRGSGVLQAALLGSVSQRVVHGATVPVTVVGHTPSGPAGDAATAPA